MQKRSIQFKLFSTYSLLLGAFFLSVMVVATVYLWYNISRSIVSTQKQQVQGFNNAVESYFDTMNRFSTTLLYSEDFKKYTISELPAVGNDSTRRAEIIQDIYYIAYEKLRYGYDVGVLTRDEHFFWFGEVILTEDVSDLPDLPPYYEDYQGFGAPEIYVQAENTYLDAICRTLNQPRPEGGVISLVRTMNLQNRFANPQAILEVQVSQREFASFMEETSGGAESGALEISVFNDKGQCLYGDAALYERIDPKASRWKQVGGEMLLGQEIFSGNVVLVYEIPVMEYYHSLIVLAAVTLVFSVVMLLLLLGSTYGISRKLSRPLLRMSEQVEKIDLSKPFPFVRLDTDVRELDLLAQAIDGMNESLQTSLDHILTLRSAELQARFLALQSQMQPHFLYNTLTVIEGLSRQGNQRAVSQICGNLSQMLRYVSSKEDSGVPLYAELAFTKSYAEIMSERFPEASVTTDIPLEMMHLTIPKLVIQPLVENAFKYAGRSDVQIEIRGVLEGERWRIIVMDNGAGFTEEKVREFLNRAGDCDVTERWTGINGMGLKNIQARLILQYQNDAVFVIRTQAGGHVEIGGKVEGCQPEK